MGKRQVALVLGRIDEIEKNTGTRPTYLLLSDVQFSELVEELNECTLIATTGTMPPGGISIAGVLVTTVRPHGARSITLLNDPIDSRIDRSYQVEAWEKGETP